MRKTRICLLFFAILAAPAAAQTPSQQLDYQALRQEAENAYGERDADRTVAAFLELTRAFPEDAESWFGLSRGYEWQGRLEQAIRTAERVQELGYVSRSSLSYRLAQLNARAGREREALRWLERALQQRYENRPGIAGDEAFEPLRDNPRFIQLAGLLPEGPVERVAGLTHDIDYLVQEAQRMHAGIGHPAFSATFAREAGALRDELSGLTDTEVLARMMRLIAILGDGHSAIYGPDPDSPLEVSPNLLPLKFYWFEEGVYIVDGIGEAARFAGSRVIRFGGLEAEDVLSRMSQYRGLDNAMTWKWMGPQFYLGRMWFLQHIGATDNVDRIELTLEMPDGLTGQYTVAGGDYQVRRKLRPSPVIDGPVPRYLSRVDDNYWLEPLAEHDALYVQFNQVRDAEEESIAEFAERLSTRLAAENSRYLIVDVRHNNGGNNSLVRPLVRAMIAFEEASNTHRIYVITGRNSFSAAQNFINRVERWTNAVFVGEPSASRPNFVGEETNLLLPWSRVRGSISTLFWQDSDPGDERAWITPDIPVPPTAADYFGGRDAALEAIFRAIERHSAGLADGG